MSQSRKLLVIAGLLLAVIGMIYGLWYAVFDEHQTLESMGSALADGFVQERAQWSGFWTKVRLTAGRRP